MYLTSSSVYANFIYNPVHCLNIPVPTFYEPSGIFNDANADYNPTFQCSIIFPIDFFLNRHKI